MLMIRAIVIFSFDEHLLWLILSQLVLLSKAGQTLFLSDYLRYTQRETLSFAVESVFEEWVSRFL